MNNFKTEIVSAADLAPGDLIERLGLGWFVVMLVEVVRVSGFPGRAVRVEFEGSPARRYSPGTSFRRRVDDASPDESIPAVSPDESTAPGDEREQFAEVQA